MSIVVSILALAISVATAWLTLFRRGTVRMTQPTTINFDQAALLDSSKNAGGMTSAGLVGHETLEGYDEAKGYSVMEGHDWAASLGFPGFDKSIASSAQVQNGMVIGLTGTFHLQGTSINEQVQTRFVTPIPQADFLKGRGLPAAGYPVSVERHQ